MRKKIWNEISQIKHSIEYLALFLDVQKKRRKWFKIFILLLSTAGIMGWKVWTYAPQLACAIIALVELAQLIENHIIMSDSKFEKLSELRTKLIEYSNHVEKLWFEFEDGCKDESQLRETYFDLRNKEYTKIQEMENKLDIPQVEKLVAKADILATNYLKKHF